MKKIYANGTDEKAFLAELNKRAGETNKKVTETVSAIIDDVRENGDTAVKNYTLKFDGNLPQYYEVPREVINDALTEADPEFVTALLNAQENIADFHNRQKEQGFINPKENGVILGYKALVDWDKTDKERVTAFIELKVSPQADRGFEKIAEKISSFPEVRDMHLMSGVFDFLVLVEGKNIKEVAWFVAEKLSTIDGVLSTSTHFILRKYKEIGVVFGHEPEKDEREGIL